MRLTLVTLHDVRLLCDVGVQGFALSAVTLALGARLGIEHFDRGAPGGLGGGYWALPALLAGVAALAAIIPAGLASASAGQRRGWLSLMPAPIASAIAVVVAFLLASKVLGASRSAWVFLAGAAGFALVTWLALEADCSDEEQERRPLSETFGIALLSLALVALSFKLLHGYGEVLALTAGLILVVLVSLNRAQFRDSLAGPLLTGGFVIVLLLALYRLFLEKNGVGHPFEFQQHYNYFSLVLGAVAGFGLLTYGHGAWQVAASAVDRTAALSSLMARAALLGLAVALTPLVLAVVWGLGAVGGFLIGLVVAELLWMLLAAWATREDRAIALAAAPHAYLVAASLVAIQFSSVVLPLGDASRSWKSLIVIAVLLLALAWTVARSLARPARGAQGGGGVD